MKTLFAWIGFLLCGLALFIRLWSQSTTETKALAFTEFGVGFVGLSLLVWGML